MITSFYKDKTLLMTGCTGFVGKVVLEKFIRCIPDFRCIYLLIRPKKGKAARDRLFGEILNSQCFEVARKQPNFMRIVNSKLVAIEGDICEDQLAMRHADRETLTAEVDVIIHLAASTDFNEPISDAININYLGCVRMLQFATRCSNLTVYTHVSTSYANCNQQGFISEKIHNHTQYNTEQIIEDILKMPSA
jgi:fatty acyl-CoA reductase